MTLLEAYEQGLEDGLRCFAWWKDGVEYVGTCGTTLKQALENKKGLFVYLPPEETSDG